MIISRRQSDHRWAKVEIGASGLNLAQAGCVITALSDILHWYKADQTPDILAKTLSFTATGKLYWNSITEKTGSRFIYRYNNFDKKIVDKALKHPTQCVLLEFPYAGARHWVWATGKDWLGRYKIADPLTGSFGLASRYGKPIGFTIVDKK